jgi:rare lipoprotein A
VLGRRAVSGALLTVLALGASGCHKKVKTAKAPAPPQVYAESGARGKKDTRPVHLGSGGSPREGTNVVPQPPSSSDTRGKPTMSEVGLASWYGPPYAGRKGADGKIYDQNAMTAAHLTLPLGTTVRVTNLDNGQSVVVRITDRGPFVHGRIIDLSLAAAKATGVYRAGVAKVRVDAYASAAQAASVSAAKPAVPGGRWCVQIGAFLNREDAVTLKNDLSRRYTTAKVIEFAGPTGHWVRINLKYPDKQTASQVAESIHVPDAEPYLIRMD